MSTRTGLADQIGQVVGQMLGIDKLPIRLQCWDGSAAGPDDAPCVIVNSENALKRVIASPGQVGLAQAYVAGDLDLQGDVFDALRRLGNGAARNGHTHRSGQQRRKQLIPMVAALGPLAIRIKLTNPPPPPIEEVTSLTGEAHSLQRDRDAIRHHYDVGNDFYRLILGPSMAYSCGVWTSPDAGLDAAQHAKHDLICRKLGLHEFQRDQADRIRLLDVGCGWGSMVIHAARHYGIRAVGVTLSNQQAELARRRVAEAGLSGRVEIRIQDYRQVSDGPYHVISSIGMAEHVGKAKMEGYGRCLYDLLPPRGRLLNHAISLGRRDDQPPRETFISRYVFPDGELLTLPETVSSLADVGFEIRDVESLREHYALTLRAWVDNLHRHWDQAAALTSEGRARVWQLYMAGSALSFEAGRIGVNQVLCVKPDDAGHSGMPLRRPANQASSAAASP